MTKRLRVAFADESGTGPEFSCYAIGVLSLAIDRQDKFLKVFDDLHRQHGVVGEFKWSKIATSHGPINMALDWMDKILRSRTASFDVIVVNKNLFHNWARRGADREAAFYQTYTYLLRYIVKRSQNTHQVFIDDRSDEYPLHHEAVETIGNRMLAQLGSSGRLGAVTRVSSANSPGVQVADVLTGAFMASHQRHLCPSTNLNKGKQLAIARIAQLIGWDDLRYDTYPNEKVNVWHFPREYRAIPETRSIHRRPPIPYVTHGDLATKT